LATTSSVATEGEATDGDGDGDATDGDGEGAADGVEDGEAKCVAAGVEADGRPVIPATSPVGDGTIPPG
jgi:hypothetical protein